MRAAQASTSTHRLFTRGAAALRGVVLDVDGTLTEPGAIDFGAMRRRVGAPAGVDVLVHIAAQPPAARAALLAAVADEEAQGLARARPAQHVRELFAFLHARALPRALLTRNNESVLHATFARVLRPHLPELPPAATAAEAAGAGGEQGRSDGGRSSGGGGGGGGGGIAFFDPMLSRAFEPPKPHPAALLHVAARWRVAPEQLVMVGDAADDMACARAAGAAAVLVGSAETLGAEFELARPLADAFVPNLRALRELLDELLREGPAGDDDAAEAGAERHWRAAAL